MPIRRFCDLCDEEIREDEKYFMTSCTTVRPEGVGYRDDSILIDSNYVNPEKNLSLSMVCEGCIRAMLKTVIGRNVVRHDQ